MVALYVTHTVRTQYECKDYFTSHTALADILAGNNEDICLMGEVRQKALKRIKSIWNITNRNTLFFIFELIYSHIWMG